MENSNLPAYPLDENTADKADNGYGLTRYVGLTKREYFAGIAMQGMINNVNSEKHIVSAAIKLADELLEQLETTKK